MTNMTFVMHKTESMYVGFLNKFATILPIGIGCGSTIANACLSLIKEF
jgi:hypothetical protein